MHFIKNVVALSLFAVAALAQGNLQFTSTPPTVEVGKSYTITWSGGNTAEPVTITLREGSPGDLKTVSTITTAGTGGSYTWTPDTTIADGGDYALELNQGTTNNYSGQFAISGGTAAQASSSAASVISSQVSSQSSVAASLSSAASASAMPTNNSSMPTMSSSMMTGTKSMPSMTAAASGATKSSAAGAVTYQSPFAIFFGAVAAAAYFQ